MTLLATGQAWACELVLCSSLRGPLSLAYWLPGQNDGLEEISSVYSWVEEPGRLQSMGLQRVGHN